MNKNTSSRYLEHLEYYKKMHLEGFTTTLGRVKTSEKAYSGISTRAFADIIQNIIIKNKIFSLLDYGCGKAHYYNNEFILKGKTIKSLRDHWDTQINLYDPCYEKYNKSPQNKSDLSICVDVLEHIPEEDIDWVINKIFSLTEKISFINVACYPAQALLPNGENAHVIIKEPKWWFEKLISFKKKYKDLKILCLCATKNKEGNLEYFPINIDDNISNYT